jgi:NADPH:quinone reductase-like Zn-dependent oxidoreductase
MKAIQLKKFGIENLSVVEEKKPAPAANEVLLKVEAVALNYLDIAMVNGTYNPSLPLPFIPGGDAAGVIEEVGDQVSSWKKGDRVMINFYRLWEAGKRTPQNIQRAVNGIIPGALAEFVTVSERSLVRAPHHLSGIEASTLPIAGLTAWNGLFEHTHIKAGDVVVTQGTGGVSIFALQLAKAAGAKVIATTGGPAKIGKLKSLGADEVIDYKKFPNWSEEVLRLTDNQGADAILDIGGAQTIGQAVASMKMHGFIGLVGFLGGHILPIDFFRTIMYQLRIQGISVGPRESFENFVKGLEATNIKPVIDRVFTIDQTQDAFRYFEGRSFVGKVVIKI